MSNNWWEEFWHGKESHPQIEDLARAIHNIITKKKIPCTYDAIMEEIHKEGCFKKDVTKKRISILTRQCVQNSNGILKIISRCDDERVVMVVCVNKTKFEKIIENE